MFGWGQVYVISMENGISWTTTRKEMRTRVKIEVVLLLILITRRDNAIAFKYKSIADDNIVNIYCSRSPSVATVADIKQQTDFCLSACSGQTMR